MLWKILALLIIQISTEEWYMPNSHIINDAQFTQLVANDKTTYKLVKFFTPSSTIDSLKAEKKWNFQIYDFNCANFPQKCFELGVTAYPFVIVYNKNGDKDEQLVGNYPMPVLQQFFKKIEQKNGNIPQQQEQTPTNQQIIVQNKQEQVTDNKVNKQQIVLQAKIQQPIKPNPHDVIQTVIKHIENQKVLPRQEVIVKPIHLQGYSQDVFNCICILLGFAYFSNISDHFINKTAKPSKSQNSNPQMSDEIGTENKKYQAASLPF